MASKESKSLFRRLTKLFRSGPVVRRKIRGLDTAIAVADKSKSSGTLLFQKSLSPTYATITSNAYNLSERLMRYQDFGEMQYCLSGDTLIAVPDGFKRIDELAKECEGDLEKTFIVYAYDHNEKKIVPALGKQARMTRVDDAWKVTFDSGKSIVGSANHRLMMRDGTYTKIEDLKPGDSMMPFYRKDFFENAKKGNPGYRWIYTMDKESSWRGWTREHTLIAEWAAGRKVTSDEEVHHVNFVKHDNRPENLLIMTKDAHQRYHSTILNGKKWSQDNVDWINRFKLQHSRWMKENNPMTRHDLTFGKILETCERVGFNISKLSCALDTDINTIKKRLRKHGFADFQTFAKAYVPGWRNAGWNNEGEKNPRYDSNVTYDNICKIFEPKMSQRALATKLNTSPSKIFNRIKQAGYKSYSDFKQNHKNHKVISIEHVGVMPLYDLTVDGYKNFATDTVISHNTPELASACDIYADETVAQDDRGRVLHIYSDNERVREILEDLFYNVLNIEFNLRSWARNLVKYGDLFLYNDVSPEYGIVNAFPIPVNEIEREENYDREDPFAVRFRWVTLGNRTLENWEISHFRLLGDDTFLPYGSSVLEPARRIWRQLILIEDAMLVYRVVRAPERRVFYIDVANVPPENVPMYVEEQRKNLRTSQVVDKTTGRVDLRYNPLSVDEDYFIPVRGGDSGTKIDTLQGGQNTAAVEDVAYIQKKLFAALKIPRAYLGYDDMLSCLKSNTCIPLTDGSIPSVEELARRFENHEYPTGKEPHVYSRDLETGKVVPGRLKKAWKTKQVSNLYRVSLDNGEIVECTENHPFLCRDKTYKRADELVVGQSLMPVYRRTSVCKSKGGNDFLDGYEMVLDEDVGEWKYTHRLMAESKYGSIKKHNVIHHVDFNKLNNDPDNLLLMKNNNVHRQFHALMNKLNKTYVGQRNPRFNHEVTWEKLITAAETAINKSELINNIGCGPSVVGRLLKDNDQTYYTFSNTYMPLAPRSNLRSQGYESVKFDDVVKCVRLGTKTKQQVADMLGVSTMVVLCRVKDQGYRSWTDFRQDYVFDLNKRSLLASLRRWSSGESSYENDYRHKCGKQAFIRAVRRHWGGIKSALKIVNNIPNNHSVAAIEVVNLPEPVWVYDLEVEKYDNFLIKQGVQVHNSKATLAQEDIRFSRTITVIQKTILAELNKLAIIHLYAHGYDNEDLQNFTLRLSNPSTVAQQQKLELWRAKFEIGSSLPENMGSAEFVQREIWGLNDDQIEEINKQRMKERRLNASLEAIEGGEGGESGGGGGDLFGGGGGAEEPDLGGGEEAGGEETPPEENAGEEPEEEMSQETELLTSGDESSDDEEDFMLRVSEDDKPVKPSAHVKRMLYNRSRRRTHGASKTHMPDFQKMTGIDNQAMKDPTDSSWIKSVVSNPLQESKRISSPFGGLSPDVWSMLKRMSISPKFVVEKASNDVITEDEGSFQGVITEDDRSIDLIENNNVVNDEVFIIDEDDKGDE